MKLKNKMSAKRYPIPIAILLTVSLSIFLLSCGTLGADEDEKATGDTEAPKQKMLSDWYDYLYACERLYGNMLWTFTYIDDFGKSPTWENLLKARMAINTGELYITKADAPRQTMTSEDYNMLLQIDSDLSFPQMEIYTFDAERQTVLNNYKFFKTSLYNNVFEQKSFSILIEATEIDRQIYNVLLEILALETDYLIAMLGDSDATEAFDDFLLINCPLIVSYRTEGTKDVEQLYTALENRTSSLPELVMEYSSLTGKSQNSLYDIEESLNKGSVINTVPIDGLPALFPFPEWFDTKEAHFIYYWEENDGSRLFPVERENISKIADGCIIKLPGITKEELLEYQDFLNTCGWNGGQCLEEAEIYSLYFGGNIDLCFIWENNEVSIFMENTPICFVPVYYLLHNSN